MRIDTKFNVGGLVSRKGTRAVFKNRKVTRIDIVMDGPDDDGLIQYSVEGEKEQYLEHELKDASFCAECGSELVDADLERGARDSDFDLICVDCADEKAEAMSAEAEDRLTYDRRA